MYKLVLSALEGGMGGVIRGSILRWWPVGQGKGGRKKHDFLGDISPIRVGWWFDLPPATKVDYF